MGILAGPLCGGLMACNKAGDPSEHFFFAMDIASFTDYNGYAEEVQRGIDKIHTSKTAEGVEQAYLPGEIEWNNYDNYLENGIPIHVDHLRGLAGIADKLDVPICWEW
jgi:ureidoglycolate dehydrogenase (NAD+)